MILSMILFSMLFYIGCLLILIFFLYVIIATAAAADSSFAENLRTFVFSRI